MPETAPTSIGVPSWRVRMRWPASFTVPDTIDVASISSVRSAFTTVTVATGPPFLDHGVPRAADTRLRGCCHPYPSDADLRRCRNPFAVPYDFSGYEGFVFICPEGRIIEICYKIWG